MTERSNWTGIAFGLTIACYAAFQQFKMPPALPLMLEAYSYDSRLAGGFMSAYAVAGLLLSLLLGRTIARRGAGMPVAAALALMTAGVALTLVLPQSGASVLAGRLIEGVAFTVLAIAGPVLANANASEKALPLVVAATAAWIPVGQLVAVGAAGPAFHLTGWSGLWWLGLLLTGALALWLLALRLRGGIDLGGQQGETDKPTRSDQRLERTQGLSLALAAAVFMLWSGQYFAYMTWLPQALVDFGLDMDSALLGYAVPIAIMLPSILATGRLLQRGIPIGRLLVIGLGLQAATWGLVPFAGADAFGALTLGLYGIGAGIVPTCLFAAPSRIAGRGQANARAFGILMTGRNTGVLAGPILLAEAFELTGGWTLAAPILGTITAAALALSLLLSLRLSRTAPA
ncbi:MFS transporter [Rhodovibrio salinarum]|nr:MFS transporter [Rhodovibrio salinarum]